VLPGPTKIDCPDGCGLFGTPTRNGHIRGCKGPPGQPCWSCIGRRNKKGGASKQRLARGKLGIDGPSLGADHEENWRGALRIEVKSGAQVNPAWTAFLRMEAQSEGSRPFGDNRPGAGIAMPPGTSDGLVMIRLSRFDDAIDAVIEHRLKGIGLDQERTHEQADGDG
jgi:hypothetical protein